MISLLSLAAFGLVLLQAHVASFPLAHPDAPRYFQPNPLTRRNLTTNTVERELGPLLSKGTLIFGPSSPAYANATSRWITFVQPMIQVVVEPATEADVSKIVKYCNQNSIEFLTRNRGHGVTKTLNTFNGLQIGMAQLQGIHIQEDEKTVLLQGGAYSGPVIRTLWDRGYVTATGSAYCVGLAGLGLGGGHGRLEGLYGLVADGFVHLNVVLADGSRIGVNATSHKDLFWAMRGAGHNFGIVTSFRAKIYPKPVSTWHYHSYVWTGDKLETVFQELNKLHVKDNGTTPVLLSAEVGAIAMDTSISKTEAVLQWTFEFNGPAAESEELLKPFNAIGATSEFVTDVPYPEIALVQGTGENNVTCVDGPFIHSSNLLVRYNVTTQRKLYDLFSQKLAQYPEIGINARLTHEGYGNKAVQAVPFDSTAYPHRDQNLVLYFLTVVPPGSDLKEPALAWAQEVQDLWRSGQPAQTYVNYANGRPYESLESVYGYEPWRLSRLRGLKAKYDPYNRFRFYEPIVANQTTVANR